MNAGICAEGSMSERRLWQSLSYTTLYTSSRGRWSLKIVQVRKHFGYYSWTITRKEGVQKPRDRIWAMREGWIEMAFVRLPETSSAEIASTAKCMLWNKYRISFQMNEKLLCASSQNLWEMIFDSSAGNRVMKSLVLHKVQLPGVEWYGATETFPASGRT